MPPLSKLRSSAHTAPLPRRGLLRAAAGLSMAGLAFNAWAADPAPFALAGPTVNGTPFNVASQRGRVVMVFYWSTDCAVCRTKLPDLRANLAGWANKPFDLVTVSVDRREADWRQYEQVKAVTQAAAAQRGVAMWAGAPNFRHSLKALPTQLPLTLVLDAQGVERYRVAGHVPAEVWDSVAELIP